MCISLDCTYIGTNLITNYLDWGYKSHPGTLLEHKYIAVPTRQKTKSLLNTSVRDRGKK